MTEAVLERQLALTGLELRDQGIASLERYRWVDDARLAAETMLCEAANDGIALPLVNSDMIHDVMDRRPPHYNCYGAIFHDSRFAWTGLYAKSTRPEAHYRDIKVWRLR